MKVTPTPIGNPFFIKLLVIGIIAHSHIGKNIPDIAAIKYPMMLFLGIIFFMNSSET